MTPEIEHLNQRIQNTFEIKKLVLEAGIDLSGIAALPSNGKLPTAFHSIFRQLATRYPYVIVMGVQFGKLGSNQTGWEANLLLEQAAFKVTKYLDQRKQKVLVIHPEDEFDPVNRIGLFSLKALANLAGLGWQGRSLLIVSPQYGPLHRLIGILTDMPMELDSPIRNDCQDCSQCVDSCPTQALTLVRFNNHPPDREGVLNLDKCLGDNNCTECIRACPFLPN